MPSAELLAAPPRLDASVKQHVQYAVPLWQRDEQIRLSTALVKGRIAPHEVRAEPIAVVGFGPSLRDTWEQIKAFPFVITCSGSHRFLIDRGIVPQWHVEVDPRPHKVKLLGTPHPDVTYLPASTCHPDYFDHLAQGLGERFDTQVLLWHVFDATEEGKRCLPEGEWAVTGGCDVGLRALTLAAFLGFRDLHVFGLDGCARGEDRHAAAHPYGKQPYAEVEYEGMIYHTTPAMLEAARQVTHELEQMPAVTATFYGEGLVQAMAKHHTAKPATKQPFHDIVAFAKPVLISAEYRALNAQLHRENIAYGVGGERHAPVVLKLAEALKTKDILDYGCGKGRLGKALPFHIQEYDPAIVGKEESPKAADIVVCTDVLEHIEPERINDVLRDLKRCVRQVGYFVIHTGPAQKTLPDGRNTHLIQRDVDWWTGKIGRFFAIGAGYPQQKGPEVHFVVAKKPKLP